MPASTSVKPVSSAGSCSLFRIVATASASPSTAAPLFASLPVGLLSTRRNVSPLSSSPSSAIGTSAVDFRVSPGSNFSVPLVAV